MQKPRSEKFQVDRESIQRRDKQFSNIVAFPAAKHERSPISVLDSPPYLGSEDCSPSPEVSSSNREEEYDDSDFAYVSRIILDASHDGYLDTSAEAFLTLEKRHYASDSSDEGWLHRRLLFDTVAEIIDRRRDLSCWDAFASSSAADGGGVPLLRRVWAELRRKKEQAPADDLNNVTLKAIMRDMDRDHLGEGGWGLRPAIEMYNAALLIEQQIFKDVIAEFIRELSAESSF